MERALLPAPASLKDTVVKDLALTIMKPLMAREKGCGCHGNAMPASNLTANAGAGHVEKREPSPASLGLG